MNLGADDYITKPFTEEELLEAIESRLAKSSILKERRESVTDTDEGALRSLNDLKNFFDDNGKVFKLKEDDVIYKDKDGKNVKKKVNTRQLTK